MTRKYNEREEAMYEPVRQILLTKFEAMEGEAYLEDTSTGKFSPKMKEGLDLMALHVMRVESMRPDLAGYYQNKQGWKERIIVEIKARKIRIKDIFQVRMYADVLNADYCILISSESLTREMREFIKQRYLLNRSMKNVVVSKYQQDNNDIIVEPLVIKELYFGTAPEPFKALND